jgi:hypothetical protein
VRIFSFFIRMLELHLVFRFFLARGAINASLSLGSINLIFKLLANNFFDLFKLFCDIAYLVAAYELSQLWIVQDVT